MKTTAGGARLLAEIGGTAAYRAMRNPRTEHLPLPGALAPAVDRLRREAVSAAERTAQQLLNRYRAGQVGFTEVVTAQASALSAQRALLQLQVNRQLAVVALIQALGVGWQAPWQEP